MDTQAMNIKQQQQEEGVTSTKQDQIKPPSQTSSPSHEFSFTISLHSSSSTPPQSNCNDIKKTKTTPPSSSFAIDLSPADDIFFHGHLLPLHLLSHLPISPRSSTNSIDNFTLPIKPPLDDDKKKSPQKNHSSNNPISTNTHQEPNKKAKPKPFFFFKWKKCNIEAANEDKEKAKKNLKFDATQVLKKYIKMVRPLLFFKDRSKETAGKLRRHTYSYSRDLSLKNRQELRGRRGGLFSAPASMRTSPTNSGHLLANTTNVSLTPTSTNSDSTMEELQAAIQAAIAHCKNSIANEDHKKIL